MSTRIRLKKFGSKKNPSYRVVVIDSRKARDSRTIEEVGSYHPIEKDVEKQIVLKDDRIRHWLSHGAQPSATVKRILNKKNITIDRTSQA